MAWPGERAIAKLVENASGQFIYAATVMRFIETPSDTPQVQLEIVLRLRPQDMESPFGPLDALYTRALMSSPKSRLAFIWLRAHQTIIALANVDLRGCVFNLLCETSTGEARLVLGSLPSLIKYPNSDMEGYTFYHKSFLDFLEDSKRCKKLRRVR